MTLLQLTTPEKHKIHLLCKQLLGIPYKFGAEVDCSVTPDKIKALDCSEMVEYIYYQLGYKIPDGSYNQYDVSKPVKEAEVGDLVFKTKKGAINHVGIVMSVKPDLICEADGWSGKVVLTLLDKFSTPSPKASQYAGLRRLIKEKVKVV